MPETVSTSERLVKVTKHMSKLPALALLLLIGCVDDAHAQVFRTHPIRLIVGPSAGGGGDGVARVTALKLTQTLGQQVALDNRPGAAGNIGAELVARATPMVTRYCLPTAEMEIPLACPAAGRPCPHRVFSPAPPSARGS